MRADEKTVREIEKVVEDHRRNLGFTPPELEDMRYQELKYRIAALLEGSHCA